jgi:hypothetical protein
MKHIRLYENFNAVPDEMRDLFGLTSTIQIDNTMGGWFTWHGPSELYDQASDIAFSISTRLDSEVAKYIAAHNPDDEQESHHEYEYAMNVVIKDLEPEFKAMAEIGYKLEEY